MNKTLNLDPRNEKWVVGKTKWILLPAKQLPHSSFPAAAFVKCHPSILGASPCKPIALATQYVHKLFLSQILHLKEKLIPWTQIIQL